jgi:hypothetical protein
VTSTLAAGDEHAVAVSILQVLTGLLDVLPVAYAIRIETSDAQTLTHTCTGRSQALSWHRGDGPDGVGFEPSDPDTSA